MSRRQRAVAVLVALGAVGLLVLQLVRPDLIMTGAVVVPWLLIATSAVVLASSTDGAR